MTKAALIFNYYELKNLYLNRDVDYKKFKYDDLITFCEIGKEFIKINKIKNEKIKNEIANFCNICPSKENCPEKECVLYRIEEIMNNDK